jgi:hypothetical protein
MKPFLDHVCWTVEQTSGGEWFVTSSDGALITCEGRKDCFETIANMTKNSKDIVIFASKTRKGKNA